jgi:hypothetical protein
MYVLQRRDAGNPEWLASIEPERWGERDRAMRFQTRHEARRAAAEIKLTGDWSIQATIGDPTPLR